MPMNAKTDDLKEMHNQAIDVLKFSAEKIDTYRQNIGPSLISVAGKIESAADKQVQAAEINAASIKGVVERLEEQENRHRQEIKEERERQDVRDERYFSAMQELSNDVKENTKIALETSHQVSTLTQAVTDQCRALTSTQSEVKELQINMAVAKAKWAIVGTVAGALSAAVVGLLFKILGGK